MQASRLISILMRLQARGRISAAALSQELEVSVRTIYRDVDQLSFAGIPVVAERGRLGGFRLLDGFRTELTGMTEAEAETLFMAGLPGPAAELGLTQLMAVARTKLMAALPAGERAERIASRFHLDATGWFRTSEPVALLPIIAQAIWKERFLSIRYATDKGSLARQLGPLGLVLKAGIWYLVAQKGHSLRTYRVGKILAAELQEPYARPKGFDLAAHWAQSSRDYELGTYRDSATILLSPHGRRILDLLGPYVVQEAEKSVGKADQRGWVRCTIPLESAEFGIRELMRLGEEVEIVSPATLRTRMVRTLRRTLDRYSRSRGQRRLHVSAI
jgi:predicted DNA-binding transcriptional regulator YafY